MRRRILLVLVVLATVLVGAAPGAPGGASGGTGGASGGAGPDGAGSADWSGLRAGVGVVDATWHVGANSSQYSDVRAPHEEAAGGDTDPHSHAFTKSNSHGVQSRLTIRAIVLEGGDGQRVALVKSDNYLAQDLLLRRVGQILDEGDSGVVYDDIFHAASHNHSSPYYSTPAWGVWLFQDVMDLRMFEYQARAMARAIEEAAAGLRPARMGATTVHHELYKGNIMRSQTADDGSPAGFPNDYGDKGLVVVRFDDMSDPHRPEPLATWINWGQHPESLDSYELITADFLAPLERFVEQATGAPLVFSQGDVGSAEGPYDSWHRGTTDDGTAIAWAHMGHAQTERGARYLADSVIEGFEEIGRSRGEVPWTADPEVGMISAWVPSPASHPYPGVSNCRTEPTAEGDPGAPVLGLPDCERAGDNGFPTDQLPSQREMIYDNLRAHGLPVPAHYDAPSFAAVEENLRLRLQAIRLGDVLIASCACEAQVDLIKNLESRTDDVEGNVHDGFDWLDHDATTCVHDPDAGTWSCTYDDPDARAHREWTFSEEAHARWQAQVHNDAAGWDALENALTANSEPDDPAQIKGNFTEEELSADEGYALTVGVGHAGDYNGYTVSYREYMAYDHYRKALTCCGPHTADWMSTRLVAMARELAGGSAYGGEVHDPALLADEARQQAVATALGQASGAAYDTWRANLPDDVGPFEVLSQPADITRFDAAEVTWRGGSNAVDNPTVRVERRRGKHWDPVAGMAGEIQTQLDLPDGVQGVADTHTGSQEWIWTANFEAFTGGPDPDLPNTRPGTYRFVIEGAARQDGLTGGYALSSAPFEVKPWDGITVRDLRVEGTAASFVVDPVVYPTTYESSFAFVGEDVDEDTGVCRTCSFRPWADRGEVERARLTVIHDDGSSDHHETVLEDGRWVATDLVLAATDRVVVRPGDVEDAAGNVNGAASTVVVPRMPA